MVTVPLAALFYFIFLNYFLFVLDTKEITDGKKV